jgi:ABC-type transport system involved in cytochrome c biogenesis permease subunit
MSIPYFGIAFFFYLAAALFALIALAWIRKSWNRLLFVSAWIGFAAHTMGLVVRWIQGGWIEVDASEKALGRSLGGFERITVLFSHPPFTNIYESLVFFSWSLVLAALVAVFLFRKRHLHVFVIASMCMADLAMGLASLSLDPSITPLVPALQSWWLHIHVVTAFLAYACFFLSAVGGILYLVQDGVSERVFGAAGSLVGLLCILVLGEGIPWSGARNASIPYLRQAGSCVVDADCRGTMASYQCSQFRCLSRQGCDEQRFCPADHRCEEGRCRLWRVERVADEQGRTMEAILPGTTSLMHGTLWLFFFSWMAFLFVRKKTHGLVLSSGLLLGLTALLSIGLGAWLEGSAQKELAPGFFLSLRSVPYHFALLLFAEVMLVFVCVVLLKRESLQEAIPPKNVLDELVYRCIRVGFPLMTLTIVTGAVWANHAWGRPWGWDPKETWSLISWIIYALYLHARMTHGWKGRKAVFIAILGFLAVVFTFLGVNLGLAGGGLHTYAGSFGGE